MGIIKRAINSLFDDLKDDQRSENEVYKEILKRNKLQKRKTVVIPKKNAKRAPRVKSQSNRKKLKQETDIDKYGGDPRRNFEAFQNYKKKKKLQEKQKLNELKNFQSVKNSKKQFGHKSNNIKKEKKVLENESQDDEYSNNWKSNMLFVNPFADEDDDEDDDISIFQSAIQQSNLSPDVDDIDDREEEILSSDIEDNEEDLKKTVENPSFMKFLSDFEQELNKMQKIKDKLQIFRQKNTQESKQKDFAKDKKIRPIKEKYLTPLESITELIPKSKPLKSDIFSNRKTTTKQNNSSLDKKLKEIKKKKKEIYISDFTPPTRTKRTSGVDLINKPNLFLFEENNYNLDFVVPMKESEEEVKKRKKRLFRQNSNKKRLKELNMKKNLESNQKESGLDVIKKMDEKYDKLERMMANIVEKKQRDNQEQFEIIRNRKNMKTKQVQDFFDRRKDKSSDNKEKDWKYMKSQKTSGFYNKRQEISSESKKKEMLIKNHIRNQIRNLL